MKKSNISKIIKMFLSARFPSETEEKVQKWIIKDKNQQAKAKASLDFWNELDVEADSNTYASLERVNLRTGYNKEHLTNIVSYQKFARYYSFVFICRRNVLLSFSPKRNDRSIRCLRRTETPDLTRQFGSMVERGKYHFIPGNFCQR